MEMSECGRIVRVGFVLALMDWGVMEERKRGHSVIALESVLSRNGR